MKIDKGLHVDNIKNMANSVFLALGGVASISVCLYLGFTLFAPFIALTLPEKEHSLNRITIDGHDFMLTCIATRSGPIILTVKSCSESDINVCKEVDVIYESGTPCDEYQLVEGNPGEMKVMTTSGSLEKSYDLHNLTLPQQ